jgi:hypothetical protein
MTHQSSTDSTVVQARRRRRRRNSKLAIAVIAGALAVPAAAGAAPIDLAGPGGPQASDDNGAQSAQTVVLRRDGSKAEPFVANVGGSSTASTAATADDGFAWDDAAIGAGATLGLIALAGGSALALRKRGGYADRSVATGS